MFHSFPSFVNILQFKVQYNTLKHSTVQHSTVRYSTEGAPPPVMRRCYSRRCCRLRPSVPRKEVIRWTYRTLLRLPAQGYCGIYRHIALSCGYQPRDTVGYPDISHSPAVTSTGIDFGISRQNNIPYNVSAKLGRHPELRSIKQPELIRTALEAP